MAINNSVFQNPSSYTGYQSLLKRKPLPAGPMSVATPEQLAPKPVIQQPKTTAPAQSGNVGSPGQYKGTAINRGTDAQVAEQIRQIDTPVIATPASKPVKGLVDKKVNPRLVKPVKTKEPLSYSGLVGTLADRAQNPTEQVTDAYGRVTTGAENLRKFRESVADTRQGIFTSPTSARVMQGRDQAVQLANAQKESALASELGAYSDLYSSSMTGQGQQLSALGTAAGLAQPSPSAYGQTVFNPLEGNFAGGGGLPPEAMQQYAQMAADGQISAVPSFITSNPVLNAQLNDQAKAINPNYNPITSGAQGQVIASIPELEATNTQAEGIKNRIVSYLNDNPGLNPSTLAVGNLLKQWVEGKQLADPKYQTLFNYLNEYTNTLAPILGVGGSPTNLKTEIAASFVNAKASGQSIAQVLESMSQLAKGKIEDRKSGATGGGVVSNPTTVSGGNNEGWGWNP